MRKPFLSASKEIARNIVLTVLATGLVAACNGKAAESPRSNRPALVTTVRYEPLAPERTLVGTIRPRIETDLGFRIPGKVARRLVEVGQTVRAGELLAVLDETDLKLQAEQAEAELRAATAALGQAEAAERRAKDLRGRGWSTDAVMDQARAIAEESRGRLSRAERSVELTRNALSYASLAADTGGVVTATLIEPGQVVAAGQGAVRIARNSDKEVQVAIPETLVASARSAAATVVLWSAPDRRHAARLRELSPAADPTTRTYLAKFSLDVPAPDAELGMTATLSLADRSAERAAKLPLSALVNQGAGPSVYVVDELTGALRLTPVHVKSYDARDVLVTGGVEEGDRVVAVGVQKLDEGQKVRVVEALAF